MKKIIMFCTALICGLMISCNKNGAEKGKQQMTGMVNPVREVTAQELAEKTGFSFKVPAEAEEVRYSTINDSLGQMDFIWKGCRCTSRIKVSEGFDIEDISGMYYSWESVSDSKIGWCPAVTEYAVRSDGSIAGICLWIDKVPGLSYSFSIIVPGIGPGDVSDVKGLIENLASETWIPAQNEN